MLNAVNAPSQNVLPLQNVLFASNRIKRCCNTRHDQGSGIITLNKPGIYKVSYNGNTTLTAAGNASLGIKLNGEVIPGTIMTNTLAAAGVASMSAETLVKVDCNCCVTITVGNLSTTDTIAVDNANIIVTKIG